MLLLRLPNGTNRDLEQVNRLQLALQLPAPSRVTAIFFVRA